MNTVEHKKKKKASTKTCPNCKATFSQKYNRDKHIKKIHQDVATFVESVIETMETTNESEDNNNEEIIDALIVSENGDVIDLNISVIDKDTPIYQILVSDKLPKGILQESLESTINNLDETEQQIIQFKLNKIIMLVV